MTIQSINNYYTCIVLYAYPAGPDGQDFLPRTLPLTLAAGASQACEDFGAADDNVFPGTFLEDIEFYQVQLSTQDNAFIEPGLQRATIFIEDNDG